jgi:hypothetical protein
LKKRKKRKKKEKEKQKPAGICCRRGRRIFSLHRSSYRGSKIAIIIDETSRGREKGGEKYHDG